MEEELDPSVAIVYIQSHLDDMHPKALKAKPPPLPLPKLATQVLKEHAVISKAKCAMIMDMLNTRQSEDEPVRKFKSRIDAIARNCGMVVACTHACCNNKAKIDLPTR